MFEQILSRRFSARLDSSLQRPSPAGYIHPIHRRGPIMLTPATLTRRQLLQFAGGTALGLNLGGLWRAQAARSKAPTTRNPVRACILIFYYGGPSHLDTFDMKPDAPKEVRGEFKPIRTSAPGVLVC